MPEQFSTPLTYLHLRFDVVAVTTINLGGYQAGERLRNAIANVILRTVCPERHRSPTPSPEHAQVCPACWLLASNLDPGEVRRAYALTAPLQPLDLVSPGERFSFAVTLYGQGLQYLPYFILAVPEAGRMGVGPGRGGFELEEIWAVDPLGGKVMEVLAKGERVVRVPQFSTGWEEAGAASVLASSLLAADPCLIIDYLSPTRLTEQEHLVKQPDFGVFFQRLLHRIDDLSTQYSGVITRRDEAELNALHGAANGVRLIDVQTDWIDLWGSSGRTGRRTPMGGFAGRAKYRFRNWDALLPWLIFGQGVHVGKLAVKGNGVYQLVIDGLPSYWDIVWGVRAG